MQTHVFSLTPGATSLDDTHPSPSNVSATLVLAFGDPSLKQTDAAFTALRAAYPTADIIGCSTAGEIVGDSVRDGSLSGAVVHFDRTRLRTASTQVGTADDSYAAGQAIAQQLKGDDLQAVFVLSDGLHVNGSDLVRGLNEHLPPRVVVTGGLAGDGDRFAATWVVNNDGMSDHLVTAVGMYGGVQVGHGSRGGWDIFGPERLVTKSKGNVLYELDGRPALALYKEYLGELSSGLPATALLFPLALRSHQGTDRQVVRTVLAVDDASQSLTFAGDIPQGHRAQLMRANFDRLIDAAGTAGAVSSAHAGQPVLSIAISCVGRRLILGERIEEELEAATKGLPDGSQQVGFYSYGELSPLASGRCQLHNQTMTVTTLSEAA